MGGRTEQQCAHRWQKTLDPSIHSGRWTLEEDRVKTLEIALSCSVADYALGDMQRLKLAVLAYGNKHWSAIARHVPGRTDVK